MGTRYAKQLVENVAWRKEWAEKIGLGFNLTSPQLEVGKFVVRCIDIQIAQTGIDFRVLIVLASLHRDFGKC